MSAPPPPIPALALHEQLLDAVGQAVITIDLDGRIAFWNRAAEELYGWSAEMVVGHCFFGLVPDASPNAVAHSFVGNGQSKQKRGGQYSLRGRNGSLNAIRILDTPLTDAGGRPAGFIGVSNIRAERETSAAEREEPAFSQTCGTCPLASGDAVPAVSLPSERLRDGVRRGGRPVDGNVHGRKRGLDNVDCGKPNATEALRRGQTALAKTAALYRTMVDTAHEGVWLIDSEARTLFVNSSMSRMIGYTAEEISGRTFLEFVDERDRATAAARFSRRKRGVSESYDIRFRRSDGSMMWALISGSPFYDENGNFAGSLGLFTDITERKRYEQGLIEAKEKAEELARLKSALLTNLSHEIRTPLTGILGFAEIIASISSSEVREYADFINQSGERLMETLNSVLELAQLESRSMLLQPEPMDVVQHAAGVLHRFESCARSRGLYLRLEHERPHLISTVDARALSRVLANLIDNGLKFTETGGVTVRLSGEGPRVRIDVVDTGIGIDAAFIPKLFDDFKQESEGISRNFEGVGLGLSITKRLVDLMGAAIDVTSSRGAGSTFTIRLPIDPPRLAPSAGSAAENDHASSS